MTRRRPSLLRPFATAPAPGAAGGGAPAEPSSILRSTALYRFTEPGAAASLRQTAEMLYDHALEALTWPEWDESPLRSELRALADDLLTGADSLAALADELERSEVAPADVSLCRMAASLAPEIQAAARRIGRRVGPWPGLKGR